MLQFQYLGEPAGLANLLQAGFEVQALVGCTLREFLCMEMEICGDYAKRRIQTIFIDGKAVDDFDEAHIHDGTRLALSGAMPGLVGAVMRRGGVLGGLRDSITYHLDELRPSEAQGAVQVKLYNFIAEELAHIFLRRGIVIETEKVRNILALGLLPVADLKLEAESGKLRDVSAEELVELLSGEDKIRISAPLPHADAA